MDRTHVAHMPTNPPHQNPHLLCFWRDCRQFTPMGYMWTQRDMQRWGSPLQPRQGQGFGRVMRGGVRLSRISTPDVSVSRVCNLHLNKYTNEWWTTPVAAGRPLVTRNCATSSTYDEASQLVTVVQYFAHCLSIYCNGKPFPFNSLAE